MFFLLLSFPFGNDDKSSKEIQQDINIRNRELNTLRNEIKNIEERLIDKNKEATQNTEILIDLTNTFTTSSMY